MCIIALAIAAHPGWPLVVAANRDELHARASVPLAAWAASAIIAGRDAVSGGTWLGVSAAGRFAAVSNVRHDGATLADRSSRGALVVDFLRERAVPDAGAGRRFNPFNLIVIEGAVAQFHSNHPNTHRPVGAGIHAFSNGALDDAWPKTVRLKRALARRLAGPGFRPADLFVDLRDEEATATLRPVEDAIFVRDAVYGTRCSTVMAVGADGAGEIVERRFDAAAQMVGETRLRFDWPVRDTRTG
ncbi:MAG: NRDE family protein [Sphingomonas sp.]